MQNAALVQSKEVLELRRIEVEKIKAEKWNGALPSAIYSGAPYAIPPAGAGALLGMLAASSPQKPHGSPVLSLVGCDPQCRIRFRARSSRSPSAPWSGSSTSERSAANIRW